MSKHSKKARELFEKGYNCSQAVLLSFADEIGLDEQTILKISSSFGAGMGRMREVCGAVSGMFMVAGMMYGYTDPYDHKTKTEHYKRIQYLAEKFKEENTSIVCRELLGLSAKVNNSSLEKTTIPHKKKRPCSELVEQAVEIMDEYIENNNLEE